MTILRIITSRMITTSMTHSLVLRIQKNNLGLPELPIFDISGSGWLRLQQPWNNLYQNSVVFINTAVFSVELNKNNEVVNGGPVLRSDAA